jgi:hypothetical protein
MRDGHDLLGILMREMMVTAGRSEMDPPGIAQFADDCPVIHWTDREPGRQAGARR